MKYDTDALLAALKNRLDVQRNIESDIENLLRMVTGEHAAGCALGNPWLTNESKAEAAEFCCCSQAAEGYVGTEYVLVRKQPEPEIVEKGK